MSRRIFNEFRVLEAQGAIPGATAAGLTYATIAETFVRNAAKAYYGEAAFEKAVALAKDEQFSLEIQQDILTDVRSIIKAYGGLDGAMKSVSDWAPGFQAAGGGSLTTSDFPKALAALRQRIIRQDTPTAEGTWREWVPARNIRTVPDFKQIRGLNAGYPAGLILRPEGTDVTHTKISFTADGYFIANYERATDYTWEMWLNDEIGLFATYARKRGQAARRTEYNIVITAVLNGVSRSSETGITTGAPDATRLAAAMKAMTQRTVTDEDGNSVAGLLSANHVVYGSEWDQDVTVALGTRFTDVNQGKPNVVYQRLMPHMERIWKSVFGSDWIVFDDTIDWLEVSFLEGFQGGPQMYTKLPDEREHPEQGSFDQHGLSVKIGHALGAKVTNTDGVLRNQGA